MAPPSARRLDGPYPQIVGPKLQLVEPEQEQTVNDGVSFKDGILKVDHPDGSTTINFNPTAEDLGEGGVNSANFDRNLAKHIGADRLSSIASDLLEGIERDIDSRKEWIDTRAMGISLLGLVLEKPRTDQVTSSAPFEGMSRVRHPLLLEATVSFQATARAELLPAAGPVKIRNDTTMPPKAVLQGQMGQASPDGMEATNDLSQALEKDMNHYLTAVATEYVPDTDRMLFYVGFGGDGFKKVYNCPLRRRPVSESVDAEDLIVSNAAVDMKNCGRVTHRIKMRKSVLRRMQLLGVYLDVDLAPPPSTTKQDAVEKKKEELAGQQTAMQRPEDRDYEIFESYCELDLDEFAPKEFRGKGLPLPYRVTIDRESRKILDIRRNWREDDKQCLAKQYFVQFSFVRGVGFYGLGYTHLLGNLTVALTAALRLQLDNGMFANFPGFLYAKGAGRQNTNQFRVPPGGGQGLDIGMGKSIRDAIMPLPYKETGAAFVNLTKELEENGRRLASTANINVGEGKQDAPVGTTLALIEQASKVMDSAHKRLHAAQAEEFKLLKERFREDPEAFWRHNKKPTVDWKKEQFLQALEANELVPVADPNNPTSLHRIAKAMAIKTLQQASPDLYDPTSVDMRIMRIADIDPEGLFRPTPAPPPPDPRMEAIQQKAAAQQRQSEIQLLETKIKAASESAKIADRAQDRASREKLEQLKLQHERMRIQEEQIIHAHDELRAQAQLGHQMDLQRQEQAHELHLKQREHLQDTHTDSIRAATELAGGRIKTEAELERDRQKHEAEMMRAKEKHDMEMEHMRELHQAKLEAARAMARAKPKGKAE